MKDRLLLAAYLATVVAVTAVHHLALLGAVLALAVVLSGKGWRSIALRAALAVLVFNSVVTLSYTAVSLYHDNFSAYYVALVNLRVLLLTYLSFLLMARVNLFRALGFSPTLVYLLTLAYSQALTFRRVLDEFRLARRSRTLNGLRTADLYRHGAATGAFLIDKALHSATEIGQAMRSRGFFND